MKKFNKKFYGFLAAFSLLCIITPLSTLAATTIGVNITTNGNLTVDGSLKFTSGAALGSVLVSDASGNATWTALDTSYVAENPLYLYYTDARADSRISAQAGLPSGLATLDGAGKVPSSQLPTLTIANTYVVADQAARLALSASVGDIAVQTDTSATYILSALPASVNGNWILITPPATVISVNGQTGVVSLTKSDVNLSNVENTALTSWPGSANITTLGTITSAAGNISLWSNNVGYLTAETDPLALKIVSNLSDVNNANTAFNNIAPSQGGNNGKFLITNGANTSWATALTSESDPNAILKSIGTAKGDLIAYSSSGTPVRLGAGTNGQFLMADSSSAGGVKWTTSSSSIAWGAITGTLSSQTDLNTALGGKEPTITAGTTSQYWRGDKSWQTLDKNAVSLNNVANIDITNASNISSGTLSISLLGVGTNGQVLTTTGGVPSWQTPSAVVETDPAVGAVNGIIKSNGSAVFSAAGSGDITAALGFTPYNATNPAGYISGITSGDVTTALGFTPYNATNPAGYITGITGLDVTTALGFTPYNVTNPAGYITGITGLDVTTALGYTPYNSTNPAGYITGINSGDVTTALGFTPYNATNPAGYITSAALGAWNSKSYPTDAAGVLTNNGSGTLSWGTVVTSETDPVVKAINGLVKSNGTTISAATAGTDYLASVVADSPLSGAGTTASHLTVDLSSKQNASSNLTSLAGLTYSSGSPLIKMTGANTFALDTNAYLTSVTGTNLDNVFSSNGLLKRTGVGTYTVDTNTYLTSESDPLAVLKATYTTNGDLIYGTGAGTYTRLGVGSNGQVLTLASGVPSWATPAGTGITSLNGLTGATQTFAIGTTGTDFGISSAGTTHTFNLPSASAANRGLLTSADWTMFNSKGSGTVTTASVISANGFSGTVATPTTTPAITLTTSVTGLIKGNGTALSAATSGTDYSAGTSALATGILKSTTTTGALSIAVAGDFPTLNQSTTGTAANVTGTVAVANGGTGQTTYTDGQLLIGNSTGNTLNKATLTAGSGISITNGSGSITIAATAGGAPVGATYITQTPDATLTSEQALNALSTGLMQVTTGTGIVSSVTTSLGVAGLLSDETGSGALVFGSSPTIVTPTIASFTNATHNHTNAAGGGQLTDAALSAAVGTAKGGTGLTTTPTNGQLLIGNGAGYTLSTLTAGNGINITNGAGSVTVSSSSGSNYVSAYDITTQTAGTGGTWTGIAYGVNGQLDGWSHTAGTANFTCNTTGLYLVTLTAQTYRNGGSAGEYMGFRMRNTTTGVTVVGSQIGETVYTSLHRTIGTNFIFNCAVAAEVYQIQMTGTTAAQDQIAQVVMGGETTASSSISIVRIK